MCTRYTYKAVKFDQPFEHDREINKQFRRFSFIVMFLNGLSIALFHILIRANKKTNWTCFIILNVVIINLCCFFP